MKTRLKLQSCAVLALLVVVGSAQAAIDIQTTDVSDGPLNITANTTIDLSKAKTGTWTDASNGTSTVPGDGIYDVSKWAVVFKYSSVNIASGKTLSFKNHASRAPVVWLVNGDVTIAGTLSVSSNGQEPGPGGFRGGHATQSAQSPCGGGFGPGGGSPCNNTTTGSYSYGNVQILPLIGGSGGGASNGNGGGGGGAILIAASGTITINGSIQAYGLSVSNGAPGSGGAIRLIANVVTGTGTGSLYATGSQSNGRIRVEANSVSGIFTAPTTIGVTPDSPVRIWPDPTAPTIRVVSVDGVTVPTDPISSLDAAGADVLIDKTGVTILLEATNIPIPPAPTTVTVRLTRKYGSPVTLAATFLDGGLPLSHWKVDNVTIPQGFSAIQAIAKP